MWIARDKSGTLNLFSEKPIRIDNDDDIWLSFVWHPENVHTCKRMQIDSTYFPGLKWEDEPVEVSIVPTIMNSVQTKLAESVDEYFDYVSHQQDIPSYNKKEEDALYDIMVWRWQDWTDVKYDKPDTWDLNFKDYDI